ncbi:MAG: hypothetical protein AABY22_33575, partial [Nanoarchaeota archaeon]
AFMGGGGSLTPITCTENPSICNSDSICNTTTNNCEVNMSSLHSSKKEKTAVNFINLFLGYYLSQFLLYLGLLTITRHF